MSIEARARTRLAMLVKVVYLENYEWKLGALLTGASTSG